MNPKTLPIVRPERRMSKLSRIMAEARLRPDKRFSQSFLVNQGALEGIVRASGAGPHSAVVEIGAGLGNLTELLARAAGRVVAVELDRNFRAIHERHLSALGNLEFVYGDFLEQPLEGLMPKGAFAERLVVGNIPYNITSRILMKLLEESACFDRAYILMQREVAERLAARPGSRTYSVLTAKLRCEFDMTPKLRLGGRSFLPPVKVESELLELRPARERLVPDPAERAEFFAMLDGAFGQRRKTLPNSLSHGCQGQWPREEIARVLEETGVAPTARAESLDSRQFLEIFRILRERLGPAVFPARRV